jgi:hypothetical protein
MNLDLRQSRDESQYQAAEHEQDGISNLDRSRERDQRDAHRQQCDNDVYSGHDSPNIPASRWKTMGCR